MTAIALVACSTAGADPAASAADRAARPAGWKQLPAIANAASAAARADGVVIDSADAWGEPAIGCYAVWLDLHGVRGRDGENVGDAAALADQILDGLARTGAGEIAVRDVVRPAGPEGVLAFAFARSPYRGRVRARLGGGRIDAVACFANQREPGACDAACTRVLQGVP
jgi:hypothetical protein